MAAEVIRAGLLEIQVCVPKTFTDEQVEEFTNEDNPTGLESRWRIQREVEDNPTYQIRCQCSQKEDHCHLVLIC